MRILTLIIIERSTKSNGEFPTNTLVEVRAMAEPGLDVEIEATVLLDR